MMTEIRVKKHRLKQKHKVAELKNRATYTITEDDINAGINFATCNGYRVSVDMLELSYKNVLEYTVIDKINTYGTAFKTQTEVQQYVGYLEYCYKHDLDPSKYNYYTLDNVPFRLFIEPKE